MPARASRPVLVDERWGVRPRHRRPGCPCRCAEDATRVAHDCTVPPTRVPLTTRSLLQPGARPAIRAAEATRRSLERCSRPRTVGRRAWNRGAAAACRCTEHPRVVGVFLRPVHPVHPHPAATGVQRAAACSCVLACIDGLRSARPIVGQRGGCRARWFPPLATEGEGLRSAFRPSRTVPAR